MDAEFASLFHSDSDLVKSISRLTQAIDASTQELKNAVESLKSDPNCATKQDLADTQKAILDAIAAGAQSDPAVAKAITDLTAKLKGQTEALDAAVKAAPTA